MAYSSPTKDELERLWKAAKEGDLETLESFIKKKKYDVDTRPEEDIPYNNATLLLICCEYGHLAAAQRLLELGADINATDENRWTALHEAAYGGREDVIRFLLEQDRDLITKTDIYGRTAVHLAAQEGHASALIILLDHSPDLIEQKNIDGNTPLDDAVALSRSNVVYTLVHQYNVDITQCKQHNQEEAKQLLAAEEAKHNEEANTSNQESLEVVLAKLEQAKANNETLKVSYTTIVFSGSSGVGKTSLFNKLNKEKLNKKHHSTGVAKSRHTICVKTAAVVESTQGLHWTNLDHDSVIKHLNKHLQSLKFPSAKAAALQSQQHTDQKIYHSQNVSTKVSSPEGNSTSTVKKRKEVEIDIAGADSSTTPSLGDIWDIINFLDTGGQPEFVNILPAVSSSIALTFIVFNLSESLNESVKVKHNVNGDPTFEPYFLDCTNLEFIKRLMVSSENFNKNIAPSLVLKGVPRKGGKNGAKICYIGTHALQVNEEKTKEVDHTLSSIARELELQQRSFWSSPKQQLKRLFPIDLFPDDKDTECFENVIEHIRDNIQNEVKRQDYYEVPITWFIFLLKIQKLCNAKKVSYISYQEAVDAWMDDNVEENEVGAKSEEHSRKAQNKNTNRENSDVHNVLLFFHLMGMLFYYHTVKGMSDFVFVDRQWLFEKLTKLVEIKFTKGYNRKDVSAEDVEKFTMEGRLSINIIEKLSIDLQGISPLCFLSLLDHLNIVAPINSTDYFMPCVLPSFSDIKSLDDLDECYGTIQHVPLLVGFKNGPVPHGFFCHLIVELFRNLPKGWIRPFLSTEEMQHVYNNLITFPTTSGHFVSIFYKIGYLEVQVRHQQCQSAIHSDVQQEVDKSLRAVSKYLQLNHGLICYGFYCSCKKYQHFVKLDKPTLPMEYIQCRYSNTRLTGDHRVWLQDIKYHKFEKDSELIENVKQKLKALKSSPVDEVVPIQEKKYSAPVIIKNQRNDNQEQRCVDIMGQKCDSLEQSCGGVQAQKYSGAKEQGSDGCGGGYRNIVINEEKCPFDDVKIIASKQLTQNGDVLDFEHCGLKVTVPEGAIEEDYCVEIQVAVSLFGPFHVPSDCRPVSPYVWIAANYLFKRKLQIEFQHHADVSDTSKLCILKACCSKFSICQMHITTQDHYVISDTVCTLYTNHFCSYCLASKSDQVADRIIAYHYLPEDYKLANTFRAEICFCYDLSICKETTEQRYMERNMFKNLNTRVNITKKDELNVSDPCSVIGWNAIHLLATKISVDEINFRELYKSAEDMKKDEIRDIYPPRFITQLNCHQRCTLDVTYTLNLLRDGIIIKDYKFSIFIEGPGSISMDSANSEILQKEPEIGDLFEFVVPSIKAHWDDVAYTALRYDVPTVEGIQRKHPNDVKRCCQEMFKIWLTTSHGIRPKTWLNLLTRLKKVDELVASTEEIEKKLKAYSCDNS